MAPDDSRAFVFICAAIFLIYLDSTIVNVALPTIQSGMDARIEDMQWLVNCYTLAFASLLLSAGAVTDMVGHRRVLTMGLAGFAVSSAGCALSHTLHGLLLFRCAQGVCAALLVPPALAALPACFPDHRKRARAVGQLAGVASLATAVGPVLGGYLVSSFDWRTVFWVSVPVALLALLGVRFTMSESTNPARRSLDIAGQVLMVSSVALLAYGLNDGRLLGWSSPELLAIMGGALILGSLFVQWERRTAQPLWPTAAFRDPVVVVACASNFLGLMGFFVTQFVLVYWFQGMRGESALSVGTHLLWMTIAMATVSPFAGRWIASNTPRPAMIAGVLACLFSLAALVQVPRGMSTILIDLCLALMGGGVAAIATAATTAIVSCVAPAAVGAVSGAASTARQLGATFGVAAAGSVVAISTGSAEDRHLDIGAAFAFAALGCVILLALTLRWFKFTTPSPAAIGSAPRTLGVRRRNLSS